MSVPVDQRPTHPATEEATPGPGKPRLADRNWVLCLALLVVLVLVFAAMIAITALAGGDGFPS